MLNDNFDQIEEKKLADFLAIRFGPEVFSPGFDKIRPAFAKLIDLTVKENLKRIIIGGTNGKGETARTLVGYLRSLNYNVALWTSPHILTIRERFQFNDTFVSYRELTVSFVESWEELSSNGYILSYYEFLFYNFCRLATMRQVEFMVLEVGLGGRLDAVNLLEPDLSAIVSISRDHEKILGSGYGMILGEKLGIARPFVPLITSFELKHCRQITRAYCQEREIPWCDLHDLGLVDSGMDFSTKNRLVALNLMESIEKVRGSSAKVANKSFQRVTVGGITFIFIGGHNIDGFRKLLSALKKVSLEGGFSLPLDKVLLSFSSRPLWELKAIISLLFEHLDLGKSKALAQFDHPKAISDDSFKKLGIFIENIQNKELVKSFHMVENWKNYLREQCKRGDTVLVTGSNYFIGEIQKYLCCHY